MQASSHRYPFVSHPLALLAVSLALGILAAAGPTPLLPALFAVMLLCLLLAIWYSSRRNQMATFAVLVLAFVSGATLEKVENRPAPENQIKRMLDAGIIRPDETIELTAVLQQAPEQAPDSCY